MQCELNKQLTGLGGLVWLWCWHHHHQTNFRQPQLNSRPYNNYNTIWCRDYWVCACWLGECQKLFHACSGSLQRHCLVSTIIINNTIIATSGRSHKKGARYGRTAADVPGLLRIPYLSLHGSAGKEYNKKRGYPVTQLRCLLIVLPHTHGTEL